MSSLRLSLFIILVCLLSVAECGTDPSCAFTRSAFESVSRLDENGVSRGLTGSVFDNPQQVPSSVCKLTESCCSKEAETSLKDYVVDYYRDKLLTKLTEPLMICHNHSFFSEFKQYIEASRANLVANMNAEYGLYFAPYIDIFDVFYGYLQSTVETGNTCRMKEEWNEIFYEVFLIAYFANRGVRRSNELPSTEAFRQCFYQHIFLSENSEMISVNLNGFLRTYNRTMRYLRALKALDKVIVNAVDYVLSSTCKESIMKMTHCGSCAGYVSPTCGGLCLNVFRGCLVDLSDLFEPLEEFSSALIAMQKSVTTVNGLYYLWGQLSNVERLFFVLVWDTYQAAPTIETKLLTTCGANGRIGGIVKRQTSGGPRLPRTSVPIPGESMNQSAYCLAEALSSVRRIPDSVCESDVVTSNASCWTGKSVGNYGRTVFDFDRESQISNPEVQVKRLENQFGQQIANLEATTRELKILTGSYQCGTDDEDEDCTIPDTCEYYSIEDAPYISPEGSASGSTSGTTPPPEATTVDVSTTTTTKETTTSSAQTTCPPYAPGDEVSGIITGGPGVGPGGNDCGPTAIVDGSDETTSGNAGPGGIGGIEGGSPSLVASSLTLIVLLCCVLLL